MQQIPKEVAFFKHSYLVFVHQERNKVIFTVYLLPMQLNESTRHALFPSRKCYLKVRKKDKKPTHPKARALVNNFLSHICLFFQNLMYTMLKDLNICQMAVKPKHTKQQIIYPVEAKLCLMPVFPSPFYVHEGLDLAH